MLNRTSLPRPQVIVFDMDGTLMDVTASFREVVPLVTRSYLEMLDLTPPPLSADVYEPFKRMTGFNEDWDLIAGLLALIVSKLPPALPLPDLPWPDQDSLVRALRAAAAPLKDLAPALPVLENLVRPVQQAGGGLEGLRRVIGTHNAHLVWRQGDALVTDLVQRMSAELYLGEDRFVRAYGVPARFHTGPGLIERERELISRPVLEMLRKHARLGIATGRTRFEALETLELHALAAHFDVLVTADDALAAQEPGGASLLKPHPFLLHAAADALDPTGQLVAAYVGDVPDDIVAARAADGARRWLAIGVTTSPNSRGLRESFLALGADRVYAHPDAVVALVAREE